MLSDEFISAKEYIKSWLQGIGCYTIEVLRKYLWSPSFICTFCSDSYGTIKGNDFEIPFGTIDHKVVILWGIDFNELPEIEKGHFLQNKATLSEYICKVEATDFYQGQVECVFTEPLIEVSIYEKYDILNVLWETNFGYRLFQGKPQSIGDVLDLCVKYKKIVFGSFDDFRSFVTDWNILILEWLNKAWLKEHTRKLNITVEVDHGSRIILENILNLLNLPALSLFKTLVELRNYVDHKKDATKKKKYLAFCELAWCKEDEYAKLYYFLIDKLLEEMNTLITDLKPFRQ